MAERARGVDALPPVQYLIMEVLAGRYRSGETLWPFPSRLRPALRALAADGWIDLQSGNVPGTLRANLTDKGKKAVLLEGYVPPVQKDLRGS